MTAITVLESGFFSTIQDLGRYGYSRYGLCASGAMDVESHILANWLVGNPPGHATLEITAMGPSLSFDHNGFLAISGADMSPQLNQDAIPNEKTTAYHEGDVLSFQGLKNGFRSYLAFGGGIDTPIVMNSRSTNTRAKIGGLEGRTLQNGDRIPIGGATSDCPIRSIPASFIRSWKNPATIRIMPGPDIKRFNSEALISLLSSPYQVSEQSDRMGMRLHGRPFQTDIQADIISAGIPTGTIQVPGSGQPIITLADGQPTGGYARLATVFSLDLPLLAQIKPGQYLRFAEIHPQDAVQKYLQWQQKFSCIVS